MGWAVRHNNAIDSEDSISVPAFSVFKYFTLFPFSIFHYFFNVFSLINYHNMMKTRYEYIVGVMVAITTTTCLQILTTTLFFCFHLRLGERASQTHWNQTDSPFSNYSRISVPGVIVQMIEKIRCILSGFRNMTTCIIFLLVLKGGRFSAQKNLKKLDLQFDNFYANKICHN